MKRYILSLLLLLLVMSYQNCGKIESISGFSELASNLKCAPKVHQIIGGKDVSATDYNSALMQLEIRTTDAEFNYRFNCASFYIGNRWFLTAAHCVSTLPGETLVGLKMVPSLAYVEDFNSTQGFSVSINAADVRIHPNYSSVTFENDIALIRTTTSPNINPYPLPSSELMNLIDQNAVDHGSVDPIYLLGWGNTVVEEYDENGDPLNEFTPPDVLQIADVELYSDSDCAAIIGPDYKANQMMCFFDGENGEQTSCSGDSGGPAIFEYGDIEYPIGITSFGFLTVGDNGRSYNCSPDAAPVVYTQISNYLPWIQSISGVEPLPFSASIGSGKCPN